jgi:hypothetical protein
MHAAPAHVRSPTVRLLGAVGVTAWLCGSALVGAALMVDHWVGLPTAPTSSGTAFFAEAGAVPRSGQWALGHVMYSRCLCSRKTIDYLVERRAKENVFEFVLLVEPLPAREAELRQAGFVVAVVTAAELARLGVDAAPAFVVIDEISRVRHAGGYTSHKQGLDREDVATLAQLRRGGLARVLPVLGCAVSQELQRILDPIGIKYDQ